MRVYLAGEGRNELGGSTKEAGHRGSRETAGVLTTLMNRAASTPPKVVGSVVWQRLPNFRLGVPSRRIENADAYNLLAAQQLADDVGATVLVALRDTDGDLKRERALHDAKSSAPIHPRIVLGTPHLKLEAWILACLGTPKAEELRKTKLESQLRSRNIRPKSTAAMVNVIENCDLTTIPPCATRLHRFLDDLRAALTGPTP